MEMLECLIPDGISSDLGYRIHVHSFVICLTLTH